MAFSIRKMLSNMNYFKKADEGAPPDDSTDNITKKRRHISSDTSGEPSINIPSNNTEPDSTSRIPAKENVSKKMPAKKNSLSENDLSSSSESQSKKKMRCKNKKLKLDINKANKSMNEGINVIDNVENTPKQLAFSCKSIEMFNERLKEFDLSKSFDIFDALSDDFGDDKSDIESLSDHSDSDISLTSKADEKPNIKMCRKVEIGQSLLSLNVESLIHSITPESFGDVELEKTEDDRLSLLHSYQTKLERIEKMLNQIFKEFQFHIEVSKIFETKSFVPALPDKSNLSEIVGDSNKMSILSRGPSPTGSWHVVMGNEDILSKIKFKKQLINLKQAIEQFSDLFLHNQETSYEESIHKVVKKRKLLKRSITYNLEEPIAPKHYRVKNKRKIQRYSNYPDLKEALENLFSLETKNILGEDISDNCKDINDNDNEKYHERKCICNCHHDTSQTDSGLMTKNDSLNNQSISSSLGNFSLDNSALTAYSETLDIIVSYNSFNDSNLYNSVLEKPAIERLSFYVQAHSIQIRTNQSLDDLEPKPHIVYYCPVCKSTENDEQGILNHILGQKHCENIHFQYKTAYIKKCLSSGKEIQPSTVLNSMTMYRDVNKIVCFGDAMYACSLCFENLIVGESVLMGHCNDPCHVQRREMLADMFE